MNIAVRVQPRAKHNALVAWNGRWKLYLTAPAVDGKANAALIEFLARTFGIAKSRVQIIAGEKSREKILNLDGVGPEALHHATGSDPKNP